MATKTREFVVVADAITVETAKATAHSKRVITRLVYGDKLVGLPTDVRIKNLLESKSLLPKEKFKAQRLTTRMVYNLANTAGDELVDSLVSGVEPVPAGHQGVEPGNITA